LTSVYDRFVHKYSRLPTEFDPDYLEMLNMSKYQVDDAPMLKPFKCANCGSAKKDGRGYVRFGLEVDWFGIVYLCTECLTDIASNAGLLKKLENKIAELESKELKHEELLASGANLNDTVLKTFEEVKAFYASLHPSGLEHDNNTDSDLGLEETIFESAIVAPEPTSNEAERKPVKSTASSRRANVPSLASLLESDGKS
jgi:hypothetical protein